ncbi:MAG TPA: LysM peptidoglycan-binding domain-containing protein [Actinokineospora sp.]|jgi:hypothetical protein|nr:LysM peptidoglycan-binding domain-containing protein [Actinokineospora sp.]
MAATLASRSTGSVANRSAHVAAPSLPVVRPARPIGHGRLRPPTRRRRVNAPHVVAGPDCAPRRAPMPVVVLLGVATVVALAFLGLGSFAGSMSGVDVPRTTTVVRVEPGESLSELAVRMAPDSDVSAMVAKIRELNGLTDAAVRVGQPLTVPFSR